MGTTTKSSSKRRSFTVKIKFERTTNPAIIQTFKANYRFSNGVDKDTININKHSLNISGTRSGKPDFKEIFINHKSEIYFQIIKSVCYYYISSGHYTPIIEISAASDSDNEIKFSKKDINQISSVLADFSQLKNLKTNKIKVIFNGNECGNSYLYALTNILRALCLENAYDSFEKLWKAYNSIFKIESNQDQDKKGLIYMRGQIMAQSHRFPLSLNFVSKLTTEVIQKHTQWFTMLSKEYAQKPVADFLGWINRNNDHRISDLTLPNICLTKTFWDGHSNEKTAAIQHINTTSHSINDAHVLATLCNFHMYFLRNTSIHGEKSDSAFRFIPLNKEHEGVKWCNSLLLLYIIDLVNSHSFT